MTTTPGWFRCGNIIHIACYVTSWYKSGGLCTGDDDDDSDDYLGRTDRLSYQ